MLSNILSNKITKFIFNIIIKVFEQNVLVYVKIKIGNGYTRIKTFTVCYTCKLMFLINIFKANAVFILSLSK